MKINTYHHIYGSKEGYKTLFKSEEVTQTEAVELESFSFGQTNDTGYLDSLEHDPACMVRKLRSKRWAITRVSKGQNDEYGRATLLFHSLIINSQTWLNALKCDIFPILYHPTVWTNRNETSISIATDSSAIPDNIQEVVFSLVKILSIKKETVVLSESFCSAGVLRWVNKLLNSKDKENFSYGYRLLSDRAKQSLICLANDASRGKNPSNCIYFNSWKEVEETAQKISFTSIQNKSAKKVRQLESHKPKSRVVLISCVAAFVVICFLLIGTFFAVRIISAEYKTKRLNDSKVSSSKRIKEADEKNREYTKLNNLSKDLNRLIKKSKNKYPVPETVNKIEEMRRKFLDKSLVFNEIEPESDEDLGKIKSWKIEKGRLLEGIRKEHLSLGNEIRFNDSNIENILDNPKGGKKVVEEIQKKKNKLEKFKTKNSKNLNNATESLYPNDKKKSLQLNKDLEEQIDLFQKEKVLWDGFNNSLKDIENQLKKFKTPDYDPNVIKKAISDYIQVARQNILLRFMKTHLVFKKISLYDLVTSYDFRRKELIRMSIFGELEEVRKKLLEGCEEKIVGSYENVISKYIDEKIKIFEDDPNNNIDNLIEVIKIYDSELKEEYGIAFFDNAKDELLRKCKDKIIDVCKKERLFRLKNRKRKVKKLEACLKESTLKIEIDDILKPSKADYLSSPSKTPPIDPNVPLVIDSNDVNNNKVEVKK